MTDDTFYIAAGDHRLEARWWAGPADTALVFLHEGLGCVDLWRDVPGALGRSTGLAAFAYSRPGYGRSSGITLPRPSDYHVVEADDILPAVLDAVGIERAVLIGHSDGGTIALMTAAKDPRIKGAVTMAAHVFNEEITLAGIREARQAWETTNLREKLRRYHGDNVDAAFHGWNDTWQRPDFADWNVEAGLADVGCPVLVVQGAEDQYGSAGQVHAIARGVAGPAQELILPDCGHSPHLEAPEPLFAAVNQFVADLSL